MSFSMHDYLDVLSSIAICIFAFSAFPQIRKILKNRMANDISLGMSQMIAAGNLLMLIRALAIGDIFFSLNYAFQFALWGTIIILIVIYRGRN
ncbi:MAG: hypothetical protein JXA73_07215 [Acidobacteria bacterium]|nr:hypothetical protein [Acidobacteriota bacterium]